MNESNPEKTAQFFKIIFKNTETPRKHTKTLGSQVIFVEPVWRSLFLFHQLVGFKKHYMVDGFKFHLDPEAHHGSYGTLCIIVTVRDGQQRFIVIEITAPTGFILKYY